MRRLDLPASATAQPMYVQSQIHFQYLKTIIVIRVFCIQLAQFQVHVLEVTWSKRALEVTLEQDSSGGHLEEDISVYYLEQASSIR